MNSLLSGKNNNSETADFNEVIKFDELWYGTPAQTAKPALDKSFSFQRR